MIQIDSNSRQIKRYGYEGSTWITVEDMVYLCEASRDRHSIEGHGRAAEAMSNLAGTLEIMLMV